MSDLASSTKQSASLEGQFFEAGSAKATDAVLRVAEGLVVVTAKEGGTIAALPHMQLKVSDRIGAVARRLTFPDGAVFVTHDNDGVDSLVGTSLSDRSVNWLEKFRPRLFVIVALTVLALVGAYRYALPVAVDVAVALTPNSVIKTLTKASLVGFEGRLLKPTTIPEERREKLTAAFNHLVEHSSDQVRSLEPRLFFHESPIGPNAFALPDGTIVITDALLKLINDKTAVGVLGHELGHVHHQHSLRLIYRAGGMFAMIGLVSGDVGGILEEVLLQGAGLIALSNGRDFEFQADAYSVELMKKTGRDPASINVFFSAVAKLEKKGGSVPNWLSTHPLSSDRVKRVEQLAK